MEPMNDNGKTSNRKRWARRGLWALLIIPILPVLLAAGGIWARAHADEAFGLGGPDMGNPEAHKAFMEKRLDKMLDAVKATDAQRTSIKAIFEQMATAMRPIHQQHKALHDQMLTAFSASTLDPAAIENLRKQASALMDQASQTFGKAVLDAGQVLSAEQRQALVKLIQEHHGRHHHFM